MPFDSLNAITAVDGRYRAETEELAVFFSEASLMRYRLIVEGEYLIKLSHTGLGLRPFVDTETAFIRGLYALPISDLEKIKELERTTNHDVKSLEYFAKEKFRDSSLADVAEWFHFAMTSEDTNNLAYALMLGSAIIKVIAPALELIMAKLDWFAAEYKSTPMLARTHGQPASPTTVGKEFKVYSARLQRQLAQLKNYTILAKFNGATGNYNAHHVAYPNFDWQKFSADFIAALGSYAGVGLEANIFTTQIEPHDTYAELFDNIRRINIILIDLDQDIWRYISDSWLVQKPKAGEIGSSTMPHKVNPIDFENSEGNLGVANALLGFFSTKLPVSRLQRDLTDSTVERNFGTALAHCLVAYKSLLKGLDKIVVDSDAILKYLDDHPEVIAEAIQTVLRREGVSGAYEQIKDFSRGKKANLNDFAKFIDQLEISEIAKAELRKITSRNYVGLADQLASKK